MAREVDEVYGPGSGRPALDGCAVAPAAQVVPERRVASVSEPLADDDFIFPPGILIQWLVRFVLALPRPGPTIAPPPPQLSTLQTSVAAMQNWLAAQTGVRLRVATDIRTVTLGETDPQIAAHGDRVRERIEHHLRQQGLDEARTLYAVWYYGSSSFRCGGGAWPNGLTSGENQQVPGHVAALYLRAFYTHPVTGKQVSCGADPFAADDRTPTVNEFKMLHEIIHTMGLVDPSAPHHHDRGHTSDNPQDLMYSGLLAWDPRTVDPGGDDYLGALRRSVFVDPTIADPDAPPGWFAPVA